MQRIFNRRTASGDIAAGNGTACCQNFRKFKLLGEQTVFNFFFGFEKKGINPLNC